MKKFRHYALLLVTAMAVFGCSKDYDDTELKQDISDLQSRVEKLETWCTTVNGQISALQGLVTALEAKDYVTGVSPVTNGYTITFSKSDAITIYNGKDGAKGADGVTPVIGVDKFEGEYYWTVKIGTTAATWMLDADGKKIRTTGDKGVDGSAGINGQSPVLSVVTDTDGKVYWKVNGEWLLNSGKKVQATGDKGDKGETGSAGAAGADGAQGDAVFAADGVTVDKTKGTVTFTLAGEDGATFTLPMASEMKIFKEFTDCMVRPAMKTLTLDLNLKQDEYTAIKAELTSSKGMTTAIVKATRAAAGSPWGVTLKEPTFNADKSIKENAVVTFDFPTDVAEDEFALLKVTVIDTKGQEHAATRIIVYSTKVAVESVTLNQVTIDVNVGDEANLIATITPADATTQTLKWESSDDEIVTVDAAGKVTGVKVGSATITVTSTADATKTATCTVTVKSVAVTGVTLEGDKAIAIGETVKLTATIAPANATNKKIIWNSSNPEIASIGTDGTIEGKAAGETTVTVTTEDGSKTATCKVEVTSIPLKAYNVGDYYPDADDSSTAVGVVFKITNGGVHGKVISLDETTAQWSTVNHYFTINDYNDGAANTKIIMEQAEADTKYPAAAWCVAKGVGWYLPAKAELTGFGNIWYANPTTYNTKFTNAGGTAINLDTFKNYYWTSNTDSGSDSAISFNGGGSSTSGKPSYKVRACYAY
ncbi:Ig-like domain-containing protein [Bacteroides ovatus]|uniref:Ig-like domain-containing protein n=1 Tax=Bacteroides ovatus TaxID=28116 RepID=UPI001898B641|nr:Ig-like domain-containing protein [Bacteroides ovatus]MDC2623808.1 Ig-like domain-containing protein [Bacteroides ovatus]MDC2637810.1 Ig-like domain-containing protein [Bacteroides ovatus]MDC2650482.1 Ig-like domain-containing protein [Bacteroides ovatus]